MSIKYIIFYTIMITLSQSSAAYAQSKKVAAVNVAVEALKKGMIDADSSILDRITSRNLSYGHSGGQVQDKAAFIHSFTSGDSDFVTINLSDQVIQVIGSTAIVRHTLSATTNDKGKGPGSVELKILLVWSYSKGQWLLVARQALKVKVT